VDYRDMSEGQRSNRSPRLPWWQDFVGQAEKIKTLTKTEEKVELSPLSIGAADAFVMRNRRMIVRLRQALGKKYLIERAVYWSRQKGEMEHGSYKLLESSDEAAVQALRIYADSGLCGTPDSLPI
jgi:hypothetical protein